MKAYFVDPYGTLPRRDVALHLHACCQLGLQPTGSPICSALTASLLSNPV
jgi:hypothetical protein